MKSPLETKKVRKKFVFLNYVVKDAFPTGVHVNLKFKTGRDIEVCMSLTVFKRMACVGRVEYHL